MMIFTFTSHKDCLTGQPPNGAQVASEQHDCRQAHIRVQILCNQWEPWETSMRPKYHANSPSTLNAKDDGLQSDLQTCLSGVKLRAELVGGWVCRGRGIPQKEHLHPAETLSQELGTEGTPAPTLAAWQRR